MNRPPRTPLPTESPAPPPQKDAPELQPVGSNRSLRVLLVEDSAEDAMLVELHLKAHDCPAFLHRVQDRPALEQALEEPGWDVVICDFALNNLNGLEVLARLRKEPSAPPCIVLSGYLDEDRAVQVFKAGAKDFVLKNNLSRLVPALIREVEAARNAAVATTQLATLAETTQAQLQFLETLMDTLPNPLYWQDLDGTLAGCNRAFERLLGRSKAELLGQPLGAVAPPGQTLSQPAQDEDLLASRTPQSYHGVYPTRDGSLEELICFRSVLEDAEGVVAGLVGILVDVTAQRRLLGELTEQKALLEVITRNLVDLLAIVDQAGKRLYSSPSYLRVLGYTSEEMATLSSSDLLHPEDSERVQAGLAKLFQDGQNLGLEYRLRHKDGTWRTFESNAALIRNEEASVPRALVLARDITQRRQEAAERQSMEFHLRQSQKLEAVGQLAAGIAHEINTPIQFISDNTSFLKDNLGPILAFLAQLDESLTQAPETERFLALRGQLKTLDMEYLEGEIPKALQQSLEGVSRVKKIVQSMKDFSHPGSETRVPTDLNRAIESTVTISRNEWKYVAELVLELDPELPAVPCFVGEFNQAILNLLVNAAHAIESALGGKDSGRMGRINVATLRHDHEVEIRIRDTGCGIPATIRERIFESFFTTKEVGRGTGQGLAIVHAVIVKKHGGRIEVESEVGQGSSFRLFLPLTNPGA